MLVQGKADDTTRHPGSRDVFFISLFEAIQTLPHWLLYINEKEQIKWIKTAVADLQDSPHVDDNIADGEEGYARVDRPVFLQCWHRRYLHQSSVSCKPYLRAVVSTALITRKAAISQP